MKYPGFGCIKIRDSMEISREKFFEQGKALNISAETLEKFWDQLDNKEFKQTALSKIIYYFGGLIVLSAMTWVLALSWQLFGYGGIFLISAIYALGLTIAAAFMWKKDDLKIPAGLLVTIAVCLVPIIVNSLEGLLGFGSHEEGFEGFFPEINGYWMSINGATILAGLAALYFFPFPFLLVPIFAAGWFFLRDLIYSFGELSWPLEDWAFLAYGALLLGIGYLLDRAKKENFAFWSYLFGTIIFWLSLVQLLWGKGEPLFILFFLLNLIMMVASIPLQRKVLLIAGAAGAFFYIGHLAYDLFQNTIWFPFILSGIGLALIYLGILYQKNQEKIEKAVLEFFSKKEK